MKRFFLRGISITSGVLVALAGDPNTVGTTQPLPPRSAAGSDVRVQLSWGHRTGEARWFQMALAGRHVVVGRVTAGSWESGDAMAGASAWRTRAGGGDVDAATVELSWTPPGPPPLKAHSIWQHLLDQGEPGQVRRLKEDPGLQPEAPVLTISTAADGTAGCSIGLEQLLQHGAMWLPDHDLYATLGEAPAPFEPHLASLKGRRVLDRVREEPEATLLDWRGRWTDFGDPTRSHHGQETELLGARGHLTGFTPRHGSIYKFGVDRWGRVRPDLSFAHKFRLDPVWDGWRWTSQRIEDGLPVLVTTCERAGQQCELEQVVEALPAHDTPARPGKVPSVLSSRFRFTGSPGPLSFGFVFATENPQRHPELRQDGRHWQVTDRETGQLWLKIEPGRGLAVRPRMARADPRDPRVEFDAVGAVPGGSALEIVVQVFSPVVAPEGVKALARLTHDRARRGTVRYWEHWLREGAQFEVPEKAVNDLFRASLWHALMLPRFREDGRMDLPYSNFAYGQTNADWPINQAVYVDYMIHGLRGYGQVAEAEFASMFRTQQQPDGRVGGFAEWGVYSPGMLYAIGQNRLLSGEGASFERLLPPSLRALDWCLAELEKSRTNPDAPGLVVAPLNDLTHDARAWAFPNAYFVAGLDVFGQALAAQAHPRAAEVRAAAARMKSDVERAFARANVRSPAVQLADGTWSNHVPGDALTPRRRLDLWYPTDVDCGPLHLARLAAVDPRGWLASAMLHDHEDNLFLNQWGTANEPVYNPQATAYLYRDEPEAAIRAFYSMLACAFSHGPLTPLEHRWAWGQYYMPPSTDGAWFELYRNMLVNELHGEGTLFIGQAVPRAWLKSGQVVKVTDAPTCFGPVSFQIWNPAKTQTLRATVELRGHRAPDILRVRLRHPEGRRFRAIHVNGRAWEKLDAAREWVEIPRPNSRRYSIVARYDDPAER
jgi:hypothetical protein